MHKKKAAELRVINNWNKWGCLFTTRQKGFRLEICWKLFSDLQPNIFNAVWNIMVDNNVSSNSRWKTKLLDLFLVFILSQVFWKCDDRCPHLNPFLIWSYVAPKAPQTCWVVLIFISVFPACDKSSDMSNTVHSPPPIKLTFAMELWGVSTRKDFGVCNKHKKRPEARE